MTDEMVIAANSPTHFPVTVIMERRPAQVSPWVSHIWSAIGITAGDSQNIPDELTDKSRVSHVDDDIQLHIYSGYQVKLYVDECDSYYHNLMSPSPHCFVVVRQNDDDDAPKPFIVSLSFDEAHAYLEGDDSVFAVDIPPELYRWTEAFVLTHYCPQQRKKRKRKDWWEKESEHRVR